MVLSMVTKHKNDEDNARGAVIEKVHEHITALIPYGELIAAYYITFVELNVKRSKLNTTL